LRVQGSGIGVQSLGSRGLGWRGEAAPPHPPPSPTTRTTARTTARATTPASRGTPSASARRLARPTPMRSARSLVGHGPRATPPCVAPDCFFVGGLLWFQSKSVFDRMFCRQCYFLDLQEKSSVPSPVPSNSRRSFTVSTEGTLRYGVSTSASPPAPRGVAPGPHLGGGAPRHPGLAPLVFFLSPKNGKGLSLTLGAMVLGFRV